MSPTPRPPGEFLQRVAERLCAPQTAQRVLLPIVADLQFEWQQATSASSRVWVRLRGSCAFARALVPALLDASADHLRRNAWGTNPEGRRTTRRLLAWTLLTSLVVTAISIADMAPALARLGPLGFVLMLPAILSTALPAGCLFGALFAGRGGTPGSIWRPLLGIAGLLALITFGVSGWVTPRTNQAYRERIFAASRPHAALPVPGDREMTLLELSAQTTRLRQTGDAPAAARFAVEWHKKPALAALCLVLALSGAALSKTVSRTWLRIGLGLLLLPTTFTLLRLGEQAADAHRLAPAVGVWGPVLTMFAFTLLFFRRSRSARAAA